MASFADGLDYKKDWGRYKPRVEPLPLAPEGESAADRKRKKKRSVWDFISGTVIGNLDPIGITGGKGQAQNIGKLAWGD